MIGPVLILPGYQNSGPSHWQSRWQSHLAHAKRLSVPNWDYPVCADWVAALHSAVSRMESRTLLVAHSLGTLTVAHWAAHVGPALAGRIQGALLVAIPEPSSSHFPQDATGFSPIPQQRLPFPSLVVASTDDPYGTLAHASLCAQAWGSRLENIGARGHINADSGLGDWPQGLAWLQAF